MEQQFGTFCRQNTTPIRCYVHKLVIAIFGRDYEDFELPHHLEEVKLTLKVLIFFSWVCADRKEDGGNMGEGNTPQPIFGKIISTVTFVIVSLYFLLFFCENFVDFVVLPSLAF